MTKNKKPTKSEKPATTTKSKTILPQVVKSKIEKFGDGGIVKKKK
jgi:hypothetical protein